jgi:hypothetical protein
MIERKLPIFPFIYNLWLCLYCFLELFTERTSLPFALFAPFAVKSRLDFGQLPDANCQLPCLICAFLRKSAATSSVFFYSRFSRSFAAQHPHGANSPRFKPSSYLAGGRSPERSQRGAFYRE